MLTRRTLLASLFALAAVAARRTRSASAQTATVPAAVDFVRKTADELIGIINGPGTLASKQARLAPVVDRVVDVDGVALFCLGRYLRDATPQQRQEYLRLFHAVLLRSVSGRLGDYAGVTVTVDRGQERDDGVVVSSVIDRPNSQPAHVDWLVANEGGSLRIIDVVAEGTSLRLTQRSDYSSYLSRNNGSVQALIDALRRQVGAA
jgi:phospholipid transport system substrate-binding protein